MAEPEEQVRDAEPRPEHPADPAGDDLPPTAGRPDPEARRPEPGESPRHADTINFYQFMNSVDAARSVFGIGSTQPAAAARSATGWLDASEIERSLARYVPPQPCHGRAADALREDRVVVLAASAGHGKRSGAISLLRRFVEYPDYVMLSPDTTLEQLANRSYITGYGYVLLDRVNDGAQQSDFAWRQVRDQVRARGAHLVITTVQDVKAPLESVKHIQWLTPDLEEVLRARLHDMDAAVLDAAHGAMPESCTLRDVVTVADLVRAGADPAAAWADQSRDAAQAVQDWFAVPRTAAEFAAITTLAFAVGSNHRTFESLQAALEGLLLREPEASAAVPASAPAAARTAAPAGTDEAAPAPEPVARPGFDRRRALRDNPLVATETIARGSVTRSVLVFADPRYRPWVLEELWATCETRFWDAVRSWLTMTVASRPDPHLQFAIATGLTQLAAISFDEVVYSYLDSWAAGEGEVGEQGAATAVQVLWCMALDEDYAAAALAVARGWAASPNQVLRTSAAKAFGGMLGVRFPTAAVKCLWGQVERGGEGASEACDRLAYLFAALVECGQDATVVTDLLRHQLTRLRRTGNPFWLKDATHIAVLVLLTFRDWYSGQPVCAVAIARRPGLRAPLAAVLAPVLVHRPRRTQAKDALVRILKSLPSLCAEPKEVAAGFGRALGAMLSPLERGLLDKAMRPAPNRRATPHDELFGVFLDAVLIPEDDEDHD